VKHKVTFHFKSFSSSEVYHVEEENARKIQKEFRSAKLRGDIPILEFSPNINTVVQYSLDDIRSIEYELNLDAEEVLEK
jgi:hypothetical protein